MTAPSHADRQTLHFLIRELARAEPTRTALREGRRWKGRIVPETRKGVRRLLTFLGFLKKRPVELFLPGFRAAIQNHRILPGDLAVTLFRASERSASSDLAADWAPIARGGVEAIDVPGHHLNLFTGGRANELSVRIAEAVARATRSLRAANPPRVN